MAHAISWVYPFAATAPVSQPYHATNSDYGLGWHPGVDLAPGQGIRIHSIASGVVRDTSLASYGNWVGNGLIIEHGDGFWSVYAHMLSAPLVAGGAVVSGGQPIGYVGNTGQSDGAHLHLEVGQGGPPRNGGWGVIEANLRDPLPFIQYAPRAGSALSSINGSIEEIDMYIMRASTGEIAVFGGSWRQSNGGTTGRHIFSSISEYNTWRSVLISYNAAINSWPSAAEHKMLVPPSGGTGVLSVNESQWANICGLYGV